MKLPTTVVSTLLLAAALTAQTNAKAALTTYTNYGNFAVQGTTRAFKTILAKTVILPGGSTSISAGISAGGVDTIVGWNLWKGGIVTVDVSEQGAASVGAKDRPFVGGSTPAPTVSASVLQGPHSLLLTIAGRAGATGVLEFWASGVTEKGADVKYAYDVGNDGSVEFAWAPPAFNTKLMKVRFPSTGRLSIKITSNVAVTQAPGGNLRYKTGASLRFTPAPHCAALTYGEGCGPRLTGAFFIQGSTTLSKFVLDYKNGSPSARGLLVFGLRRLRIPLPGTKCPLLTDPHVFVPFRTNNLGEMSWTFLFPTGIEADVKMQAADLAGDRIHASNGLDALCVK